MEIFKMVKINLRQRNQLRRAGVKIISLKKSKRKDKQYIVKFKYKMKKIKLHFGDPKMKEYPGTKRGDAYCARSYGIKTKSGRLTHNNPLSANFWSRIVLWHCSGKKSLRR